MTETTTVLLNSLKLSASHDELDNKAVGRSLGLAVTFPEGEELTEGDELTEGEKLGAADTEGGADDEGGADGTKLGRSLGSSS